MFTCVVVLVTVLFALDNEKSLFNKIYFNRSKDWIDQLITDLTGIGIIMVFSLIANVILSGTMMNSLKDDYIENVYMQVEPVSYESYKLNDDDVYTNELSENTEYEDHVPVYVGFSYLKGDIIRNVYAKEDNVSIIYSDDPHVEIETYEYHFSNPLTMKLILFPFDNLEEHSVNKSLEKDGYLTGYKIYIPEDRVNSSIRFLDTENLK